MYATNIYRTVFWGGQGFTFHCVPAHIGGGQGFMFHCVPAQIICVVPEDF